MTMTTTHGPSRTTAAAAYAAALAACEHYAYKLAAEREYGPSESDATLAAAHVRHLRGQLERAAAAATALAYHDDDARADIAAACAAGASWVTGV